MNFEDYKNTLPYPKRKDFIEERRKEIQETFVGTMKQIREAISNAEIEGREEYNQAIRKYREEDARLNNQFKEDLSKEFGVENNSKRDLLYHKAYEMGHSSGYSEIYNVFADLVELIM